MNLQSSGNILFVEALDGKDGLSAGNFGDLILLDFNEQQVKRLNYDSFYDLSPTWSALDSAIYFESKRDPSKIGHGLGKGSSLYKMTIKNGQITDFGVKLRENFPSFIGTNIRQPSHSVNGNYLAFISNPGYEQKLVIVNLEADTISFANIQYDLFGLENLNWSLNNKFISFEFYPKNAVVRAIAIYNLESGKPTIVSKEMIDGPMIGKGAMNCSAGSWLNDSEVIFSCGELGGYESTIYKYDLSSNESSILVRLKDSRVFSPQINRSTNDIIYIGINSQREKNIFLYDLDVDSVRQITFDSKSRSGLHWFE